MSVAVHEREAIDSGLLGNGTRFDAFGLPHHLNALDCSVRRDFNADLRL